MDTLIDQDAAFIEVSGFLSVADCAELTGIDHCAECMNHPDYENDTASCLMCDDGYYLFESMGNGTEAECKSKDSTKV